MLSVTEDAVRLEDAAEDLETTLAAPGDTGTDEARRHTIRSTRHGSWEIYRMLKRSLDIMQDVLKESERRTKR